MFTPNCVKICELIQKLWHR